MTSAHRCARLLLVAVTLIASIVAPPGATLAQGAPPNAALAGIEGELNLMLARYVHPLEPSALLQAGLRAAAAVGSTEQPIGVDLTLPADRAGAWAAFQQRFETLVGASDDPAAMVRSAERGMAGSVTDCHTHFAPSYAKELASRSDGERYGGIGATVLEPGAFDPPAPGPVIISVVEGGPAATSGVRPGDAVIAVDGAVTAGLASGRVIELVRGAPATQVRLLLDRPGSDLPIELAIERSALQVKLLETRLLPAASPGGQAVGYVHLRGFAQPVEAALPRALDQLRDQGAAAWVLDLRDDPGGDLSTFVAVASLFIKEGPLAFTTDRNGAETAFRALGTPFRPFSHPMAILVARHTASASELLALDLGEYGVGRTFGETTAGCFGASQLFRLPDESGLWLTVRTLESGRERKNVHQVGITPDEVIQLRREDLAARRDAQLERARAWLRANAAGASS